MTILDCQKDREYIIESISTNSDELAQRFYSMGLCEGNTLRLENISTLKNTYSIIVLGTKIALRKSEALAVNVVCV